VPYTREYQRKKIYIHNKVAPKYMEEKNGSNKGEIGN
jgi:hypothetical protein